MYAEINTPHYKGIFEVVEIIGSIVGIKNPEGNTYDCSLPKGEILKFCDKDGKNYIDRKQN